jgi:protein MAK16
VEYISDFDESDLEDMEDGFEYENEQADTASLLLDEGQDSSDDDETSRSKRKAPRQPKKSSKRSKKAAHVEVEYEHEDEGALHL